MTTLETELTPVARLGNDIRAALRSGGHVLTRNEARFLVDAYYTMQRNRIRSGNQVRALSEAGEPSSVIRWFLEQDHTLEQQIAKALDYYSNQSELGRWARSITGVGPVIASGLLAHIDIEKAPTVGHIWRFAGLDPTVEWKAGQKRPWNASLKTLCWKLGESFVKVIGREGDVYGKVYAERKAYEQRKNEAGEYADKAAEVLKKFPRHAQRAIYEQGKLSPGHIHARAKRYAVKLFLSHYHAMAYRLHFGKEPPLPYPIAILGHAHVR